MEDILSWREEIDEIDVQIAKLLSKRFELSRKIGEYKLSYGLPIEDVEREKAVERNYFKNSENVPREFLEEFLKLLFRYSKKVQKRN
jgi:chorismate mutase